MFHTWNSTRRILWKSAVNTSYVLVCTIAESRNKPLSESRYIIPRRTLVFSHYAGYSNRTVCIVISGNLRFALSEWNKIRRLARLYLQHSSVAVVVLFHFEEKYACWSCMPQYTKLQYSVSCHVACSRVWTKLMNSTFDLPNAFRQPATLHNGQHKVAELYSTSWFHT